MIIEIEKRKLDYLLTLAKAQMEDINKRFGLIDERMKSIEVGAKMLLVQCGERYPVVVTEIIDKEQGIVKIYEESIKCHSVSSVLHLEIDDTDVI